MRKSFDGLAGEVRECLGNHSLSRELFVFCKRKYRRAENRPRAVAEEKKGLIHSN